MLMSSSPAPNAISVYPTGDEHQKFHPSSAKPAPLNTQLKNSSTTQLSSTSSTSPIRSVDDYSSPEFHICNSHSSSQACIELHSPSAHSLPRSVSSRSPSPELHFSSRSMPHDTMTGTDAHDVAAERPPRFGFRKPSPSSSPESAPVDNSIPDAYQPRGRSNKTRPLPPAPRNKADPYGLVPNYPFGERLSAALGVSPEELGEHPDAEPVSDLKTNENDLTVTEFPADVHPINPFRVPANVPLPPSQDPSRMSSPVAPTQMAAEQHMSSMAAPSAMSHMSSMVAPSVMSHMSHAATVETMSMSDSSHTGSSITTPASSTTHMMRPESPATTVEAEADSGSGDSAARHSNTRPPDFFPPPPGSPPPAPPALPANTMAAETYAAPAVLADAMMPAPAVMADAMAPAPPTMADAMVSTPAAMAEAMMTAPVAMADTMMIVPTAMADAMMVTSTTMADAMMPAAPAMAEAMALAPAAMNDTMMHAPAMMADAAMPAPAAMTRPSSSVVLTEEESANLEPVPEYMRHPDQSQGEETVDHGPRRPFQAVRQALRPRRAEDANVNPTATILSNEPPPYVTPPEDVPVAAPVPAPAASSSSFSLRNLFTRSASLRERSSSPKPKKLHKRAKSSASTLSNAVETGASGSGEMSEGAMVAGAEAGSAPATAMMADTPAGMASAVPAPTMMDAPANVGMASSMAMAGTPAAPATASTPASARTTASARTRAPEYGVVVGAAGPAPPPLAAQGLATTPSTGSAAGTPAPSMSDASGSPAVMGARMEAMSMESDPALMPTTTPTPGHPLLNEGEILVYPGGEACPICHNTGYHTHKFDPLHPCKGCWAKFSRPINSLGSKLLKSLSKKGKLQKPVTEAMVAAMPGGAAMMADAATMSDASTMADGSMMSDVSTMVDGDMPAAMKDATPAPAMMADVAPAMMADAAPAMMADAAPAMMADAAPAMMADAAPAMMAPAAPAAMVDAAPAMMADATPAAMHDATMATSAAMVHTPAPGAQMQDAPASMMAPENMPAMWKEHMQTPMAPNGLAQLAMIMTNDASHAGGEHMSAMAMQPEGEHAMTDANSMAKRKSVPAMMDEHAQHTPSPAPVAAAATPPPPAPVSRPPPSAPPAWLPQRAT